jgi:hypothetical protein
MEKYEIMDAMAMRKDLPTNNSNKFDGKNKSFHLESKYDDGPQDTNRKFEKEESFSFQNQNEYINNEHETTLKLFENTQKNSLIENNEDNLNNIYKGTIKKNGNKQESFSLFENKNKMSVNNDLAFSLKNHSHSYENQPRKQKLEKMELIRDSSTNKIKWEKLKRDESAYRMNIKVYEIYESNTLPFDYGEENLKKIGQSDFVYPAREKKYSLFY